MKGILKWTWSDENGKLHTFRIPNSYYDPNGSRLLSPQHWSQELKRSGKYKKVYYTGDDQSITLYWDENYRSCEYKSQRVADLTAMSQEITENKSVQCMETRAVLPEYQVRINVQDQTQSKLYKSDQDIFPSQDQIMSSIKKLPLQT